MNILINLGTLKKGGGQNVGINFLHGLVQVGFAGDKYLFIVPKNSVIEDEIKKNELKSIAVSRNPYIRIMTERIIGLYLKYIHIDIIYTIFGYGNFPKTILQISGVADSNLFNPQIDFWKDYRGLRRLGKQIIDNYRVHGYKQARALVFENSEMEKQFHNLCFSCAKTIFIKPSFVDMGANSAVAHITKDDIYPGKTLGLFLCGWQLNKGIMYIPEIVYEVRKQDKNFEIVITAPNDKSDIHRLFIKSCKRLGIDKYVHTIGNVAKENLEELYCSVDYVFLLSRLESFSNNIVEAWHYRKLLVISDLDWAHAICGNAALYVDRDKPGSIANALLQCNVGSNAYHDIIANGNLELLTYPSIVERTKQEIAFIKSVYYEENS